MSIARKIVEEAPRPYLDHAIDQLKFAKYVRKRRFSLYVVLIASDSVSVVGALFLSHWLYLGFGIAVSVLPEIFCILASTGIMIVYSAGYSTAALTSRSKSTKAFLTSLSLSFLLVLLAAFGFKNSADFSRFAFSLGVIGAAVIGVTLRIAVYKLSKITIGEQATSQVLIDDRHEIAATKDAKYIQEQQQEIVLYARRIGIRPDAGDPFNMMRICDLLNEIDKIYVHCEAKDRASWAEVLKSINSSGAILLDEGEYSFALNFGKSSNNRWAAEVNHGPLSMSQRATKRLLDLALTIGSIPLWMPVVAFVGIAVKFDSKGPILFRQIRIGRDNRPFEILKFRSMRVQDSDINGTRSASRDDDRVTRVGKVIRKTSLDELPQLFNVLKGDMSLVGPRPHAAGSRAEEKLFWDIDQKYWHRHTVKPGITGRAQIAGLRGATDNITDLTRRLEQDLQYTVDWTVSKDIKILVRTLFVVTHNNAF